MLDSKDYEGIRQALTANPSLANEGIPYDEVNVSTAHPLHRICDRVFSKTYTDDEAVTMARIFLEHGAEVDGVAISEPKDTPLVAAASLHADKVAMLYIEHGANVNHAGCHGGTALHWAAWCGRPALVSRLLQAGAPINKRCLDFDSTPLFWAAHGLKTGDKTGLPQHLACIKILIQAGAEASIPNREGVTVFDLLADQDLEVREQLKRV